MAEILNYSFKLQDLILEEQLVKVAPKLNQLLLSLVVAMATVSSVSREASGPTAD